tara:strand:+ start:213 stop:710 length:498 start_codon:yes stop_codon:yes gene_type:complete
MKITKQKLINLIKEEVSDMSAIEDLLKDLLSQLEKLDVSIDYLASSLTGEDPLAIGISQQTVGRFAAPSSRNQRRNIDENKSITKKNLKNLVKQVISEQNIDLSDLEDELEGKTDKEMEEDIFEIAKRLVALEKKMKEMSDQYQAATEEFSKITARSNQTRPEEQ